MSRWSVRSRSRLALNALAMFSGLPPVLILVHSVIWSRQPLVRIQSPVMRSDELISSLTSRASSMPKTCFRLILRCPPPYSSAVSKKVIPFSSA